MISIHAQNPTFVSCINANFLLSMLSNREEVVNGELKLAKINALEEQGCFRLDIRIDDLIC